MHIIYHLIKNLQLIFYISQGLKFKGLKLKLKHLLLGLRPLSLVY